LKGPSKKIIYLGIGAILVVSGIFLYKNHVADAVLGEKGLSYEAAARLPLPPVDTDSDGLSDSQETTVWHTDPKNPDTDGDGTSDGDEVNQGRDPSKPNTADPSQPNDFVSPGDARITAALQTTISSDGSKNNNLTQNLSKNFFTSYLSAQDRNGVVADNDRIDLIKNTISNTSSNSVALKYTIGDLDISGSETKSEIKSYANIFALIYKNNLTAYLRIKNPNYIQTANYYQNLSRELSKLRVPQSIAATHLQIINNYDQMYTALIDLYNYDSDPLKGLMAVQNYQANQNVMASLYSKIADYLKNSGIMFTKDEPGSFWSSS
jgi:hypothetical protein